MIHVLIVDDKEENLYYLEALLTGHGFRVTPARHGAEALILARQSPPDLIVSDLLMPIMDGYTLLRHWKSDNSLKSIPFIVYTATYTEAEDERLALNLGADAFILKPTEPEDFLVRLREVQANAAHHTPTLPNAPDPDEAESFKLYSETLIRKLEEKTLQLEQANSQLQNDIAQREKIELALRESEAESRLLTETMPQIVWMASPDGNYFHFNQKWTEYTGAQAAEGLGCAWVRFLHPDDQTRALEDWDRARQQGEAYETEERLRRADGAYRWMLWRAVPLRDEQRAIIKWFGTCTDIDALKHAEKVAQTSEREQRDLASQLEAERAQLVTAQEVAKLGSWELDFATDKVSWSAEMFRIFEITANNLDLPYSNFLERLHPEDRKAVETAFQHSLTQNRAQSLEHRILLPDGRIKFVEERWQVVRDSSGRAVKSSGTCQDITQRKQTEAQRDRFFTLSLDMLCIANAKGLFTKVNPAFTEVLGFTEAELMAEPALNFVHPEDRYSTQKSVENLWHGKSTVDFESRVRTKDGSWRWLEWKVVGVLEEGCVYGAARDITERKETEAELRRIRDKLEIRVHERTLELKQANSKLQTQIIEKEEAEAETRIRARQQETVAELGHLALTDIDIDTLLKEATTLVASTLDVEVSAVMELDESGETLHLRAATREQENSRGWMRKSSNSQAGYALQSDSPLVVTDLRTETRFQPSELFLKWGIVSCMTVIIRGYNRPFGTLGAHTTQRRDFTRDDVNFLQSMSNVLAAALERRRIETEIRQLNVQLEQANKNLTKENTERLIAMGVLSEVAKGLELAKEEAERARENAEVANRAKSEFLSRMSHELRTPLNAILGFGQLLEMTSQRTDSQNQKNIQMILQAGRHLLELINEVLDITRIEAGHLSLSPEPVNIYLVVREVLDLARPLAANRRITLHNDIRVSEDGLFVVADQQRLKQVLLNLLSNAVKYNRESGSIHVSCQFSSNAENAPSPGCLRISIRDTGIGLTPTELPRLFEPFERLHAAHSQIEGTGIGLSLSKKLIEAMKGRIGVESEVGVGSTFWIELPLTDKSKGLIANYKTPMKELVQLPPIETTRTILYIEDNLSNINLIEQIMEGQSEKIRILPAMQGGLGLELAIRHCPDLILLDLNLPDLMGDDVLIQLKSNPTTHDIPVVVLSADATARQIERLLNLGASYYLTKPIDLKQFLVVLKATLNPNKNPT